MRYRVRAVLAASLVVAGGVVPAIAQPSPGQAPATTQLPAYRLQGTVKDNGGNLLPSVEVALVERDTAVRVTRTDSSGRFVLEQLTAPSLKLRIRRVGFQAQTLTVNVTKAGRTAKIDVTLDPSITTLETVLVDDDGPPADPPNPRLVAFRERAATNSFGHFVTPEMIDRIRPQQPSDALRTVSGVILRPAPTGRIGNTVRLRGCGLRDQSADRRGPLIWLDGVRLQNAEIDEVTAGPDIAAIEVYNSLVGVPAQFLDRTAVCGTILIWTKHR